MEYREKTIQELGLKAANMTSKWALVGFDGFIDKIVHPVDQRHGQGDDFTPIATIAEFGRRITAAAGKSANIEMYPIMEKLGGNGPLMANGLLAAGAKVRYIGALGRDKIHPIFERFAKKTKAVSLTEPGITTAAEFKDGKIIFGDMQSLGEVNYDSLLRVMGEGAFLDAFSRADLIAMTNWTMLPNMTRLFTDLIERVFPNLGPRDQRLFFIDLADPAKRSESDIVGVLNCIKRFQSFGSVTLGLNLSEAQQIYRILGHEKLHCDPDGLKKMATLIRQDLNITTVVVHPTHSAACANREGSWWVEGPYCEEPKISTGAGDHFNAGFTTGQLLGLSPEVCLTTAVCFSGCYVRSGKSPSLSEVVQLLSDWNDK